MSETSAHKLRRRAGAQGFGAAWDAALRQGVRERVVPLLIDKAVNGTIVRRYYHGQLVAEERVVSERLLLAFLARADALLGGGAGSQSESVLGDWDAALERLERGGQEDGYGVWRGEDGSLRTNFPPPSGFHDYRGTPGAPDFERPLTEAEECALAAQGRGAPQAGAAARDAFFGFTPRRRAIDRRSRSQEEY